MDQKIRCQSCGMPLALEFYGTNADSSETQEYCKFCYQNGVFVQLEQTLEEMIQSSVTFMMQEQHMSEVKARALATNFIPQLKRWKV